MTPRVFGIVLAGGASSRFGSDKLAATVDGRPLLHHALDAVGAVADHVLLVLAPGAPVPDVPAGLSGRLSVARDAEPHLGPLAGIATALDAIGALNGGDPRDIALVVGGDMPSLVPAVLRLLVATLERQADLAAMTLAAGPDPQPLPLAIRTAAGQPVEQALQGGRRSLRAVLERVPAGVIAEPDWRALDEAAATLVDIDRPGDLRA